MNDDIRLLIDRTAVDCIEGKTAGRDTIVQLLGIDPLSEEDIARAILESLRNPMPQSKRTLLAEQFEEKYSIKNQSKRYIDLISRICKS